MEIVDWLSSTALKSDAERGLHALIDVRKPVAYETWTLTIMQECLESMLFEMTWVFLVVYIHNGVPFQRSYYLAASGGQCGHGSSFKILVEEVARDANGTLKELLRPWQSNMSRR